MRGWPKGKPRGPRFTATALPLTPDSLLLRAWRQEHGLTHEQMATALGCSNWYLYNVEKGGCSLSAKYRARLGVPMSDAEARAKERSAQALRAIMPRR